jgi:hypothetical protein
MPVLVTEIGSGLLYNTQNSLHAMSHQYQIGGTGPTLREKVLRKVFACISVLSLCAAFWAGPAVAAPKAKEQPAPKAKAGQAPAKSKTKGQPAAKPKAADKPVAAPRSDGDKPRAATPAADATAPASGPKGALQIDVAAEVTNAPLAARVELHGKGAPIVIEVPQGKLQAAPPAGKYAAHTFVYEDGIPILVDARDLTISTGKAATLSVRLLEGTGSKYPLLAFDRDFDLVLDRVEKELGTNWEDPTDIPGRPRLEFRSPVLSKEGRWYRGELHAQSRYGRGTETVAELVKRAEALGLDFLAIADPNTLAAAHDPAFTSSSVVLIPAMLWGDDDNGYALIYGPATYPDKAANPMHAQAISRLVQAQGGVVAAAHPCFPGLTWQWNIPYVNAVQVWCRDWGKVPPIQLAALRSDLQLRTRKGELIHSIAAAADAKRLSANGQAALFWDYELVRGRKSAAIGGSMTGSPKVPMGQPLTYVYAEEKSVAGILDGIRKGRTYVTSGLDGPRLSFDADAMRDSKIDVGMGGAVPIGTAADLIVTVLNGEGRKLEILHNGIPICSKIIEKADFTIKLPQQLDTAAVYRARVIESGPDEGFGVVRVVAMTSPIYAEPLIILPKGMRPEDIRFTLQDKDTLRSGLVSPVYATGVLGDKDSKDSKWVRIEKGGPTPAPAPQAPAGDVLPPFNNPRIGEIVPQVIPDPR